ncbi:MAG TPA: hypothetical protein VNA16_06945 [Abditibacteriaceae bacterium]|nr:hypothetical protein [Abditibacteriaceae bacterium]
MSAEYSDYARSHFDNLLEWGLADFGPDPTAMWLSSLDTKTQRMAGEAHAAGIEKRVYRNIDAPGGATLYWDQPAIVAAHALSAATGDVRYGQAADAYVRDFLARCVAPNGLFLWGNHYFFDVACGQTVWFGGTEVPKPCNMAEEISAYHETRPIPPAWETFWRISPAATERCIRMMGERHVVDPKTGCFNRHADRTVSCAFLESGGILCESLAWLASRVSDASLVDLGLQIARYSFEHRGAATGLLENNPTEARWDKYVCTTEVGLWAGSLLRAEAASGRAEFAEMADAAMRAYLRFGHDAACGQYYGRLRVADGSPVLKEKTTLYEPGRYAALWNPLFPTHDYPLCFAETCLQLLQRTDDAVYREAVSRWVEIIEAALPANSGAGAYAEHYGRCMHFLWGAARLLKDDKTAQLARAAAQEAIQVLFVNDMFRSHPGENRYDAVDGVGFLLLSLIFLQTGNEPELMGFGF